MSKTQYLPFGRSNIQRKTIPRATLPIKWQQHPDNSNEFTIKLDLLRGREAPPVQQPSILKADMFVKKYPRFDTPQMMFQVAQVIEKRTKGESLQQSHPKLLERSLSTVQAKYRFQTGQRKKALDLQNWLNVQMKSIESVDRTLPELIDMKQQVVQIMFNQAISWVQIICTDWAKCFRTALNALCLLISKTFAIISKKNIHSYKENLSQNINIHKSYMSTIDNLKQKVKSLNQEKQFNEQFSGNLVYNMRVRNKQLKHIERNWKLTSNKYQRLKSEMKRLGLEVVDKTDVRIVMPQDFRIVTTIPPSKAKTNKAMMINGKKTGRPPTTTKNTKNQNSNNEPFVQNSVFILNEKPDKQLRKKHKKGNNTVCFKENNSQHSQSDRRTKKSLDNLNQDSPTNKPSTKRKSDENKENRSLYKQRNTINKKQTELLEAEIHQQRKKRAKSGFKIAHVSSTSIKPSQMNEEPNHQTARSRVSLKLTENEDLAILRREYLQTKKLTGRTHFFMDVYSLDEKEKLSSRSEFHSQVSSHVSKPVIIQNQNFKWFMNKSIQTDLSVPFHVTNQSQYPSSILKYGLKQIRTSNIKLGQYIIKQFIQQSTQTQAQYRYQQFSYQSVLSMKVISNDGGLSITSQLDSRKSISVKRGVRHSILKTIQQSKRPQGRSRGNQSISSFTSDIQQIMETSVWKSKLSKLKKQRAPRATEVYRQKTRQSMGFQQNFKSNRNVDFRNRKNDLLGTFNSLHGKQRTMSRHSKFDDSDQGNSSIYKNEANKRKKNSSSENKKNMLEEIPDERKDAELEKSNSTVQFQEKGYLSRRNINTNLLAPRQGGRSYAELPSRMSSLRNSIMPVAEAKLSSKSVFKKTSRMGKPSHPPNVDIIEATVTKCLRTDRSNNKQLLLPNEVLVKAKQAAIFFTKCLDLKDGSPFPSSKNKNNHADYLIKQVRAMYLHGYKQLTRGEKQLLLTNIIVNYFGIMYGNLKNVSAKQKITKFLKKVAQYQHKDTTLQIFCILSEVGANANQTDSVICVNDLPMYLSMLFTLNVSSLDSPITTMSKIDTHLQKILAQYIGQDMAVEIYNQIFELIKSKIACRSKTDSHIKDDDVHIDLEMMCLLIIRKILKERLSFKVDFKNIFEVVQSMENSYTVSMEFFEFLNRCINDSKIGYISRMKKFLKQCEVLCKNRKCMSQEKFSMFALKNGFPKFSQISKQLQKSMRRRKTLRHIKDFINHENPVEQWKKQKAYLEQELVHSDKLVKTENHLMQFITNMIPRANDAQAEFLQSLYEMVYYQVFDSQSQRLLLLTISSQLTELYITSLVLLKEKV